MPDIDIVERLETDRPVYTLKALRLRQEAAAEITRLRGALKSIAQYAPRGDLHFDNMIEIARTALSKAKE
jgi:hypothetical protein